MMIDEGINLGSTYGRQRIYIFMRALEHQICCPTMSQRQRQPVPGVVSEYVPEPGCCLRTRMRCGQSRGRCATYNWLTTYLPATRVNIWDPEPRSFTYRDLFAVLYILTLTHLGAPPPSGCAQQKVAVTSHSRHTERGRLTGPLLRK